jgi:tetrahydromethanopterin S-methyltransferase subunit C
MWKRVRFAEKVAGLSALALVGFLFLDWFTFVPRVVNAAPLTTGVDEVTFYGPGSITGWDSLGWFALGVCVLAIVAGVLLPFVLAFWEAPVLPVSVAITAQLLGGLAVVALIVQNIFQPGDNASTIVLSGWWLGLIAAAGIAYGGFLSIRDEHSPAAKPVDVPVRPAPAA